MKSIWKVLLSPKMLVAFLTGVSSGLPLLITGSTLQAWMTDLQMDLSKIGLFSLAGLPFTLKFAWAPFMDRFVPPFLGRRRGWILISQLLLALAIIALGQSNPLASPLATVGIALALNFFAASQDIVLDAYRRELLKEEELGFGTSVFVMGYRIGMLISGAFALFLAEMLPWPSVFMIIGGMMAIGIVTTLFAPEPEGKVAPPHNFLEAVGGPLLDFFSLGRMAFLILGFILLYKVGDALASSMTTPFILKLGYAKGELAAINKGLGMLATIGGALLGGALIVRLGTARALILFGFLQMISTLGFMALTHAGHSLAALSAVVAFENFTGGMGTSAYTAYMASVTNRRFSATQYALLTSLMGVPRVFLSSYSGYMAESMGWSGFFLFCTLVALPGMALLRWLPASDATFKNRWGATERQITQQERKKLILWSSLFLAFVTWVIWKSIAKLV
jgi:PAT family beta-lactamase induction signal transducer AmpG